MNKPEGEKIRSPDFTTRTTCRVCGYGGLKEILSLGNQHLVGFSKTDTKPVHVPLTLCRCEECNLIQLKHTTEPSLLWNGEYGYVSGVNRTMAGELTEIARTGESLAGLDGGDIVVDIGCNDGTLLAAYNRPDIKRVGFDPSRNVFQRAVTNLGRFGIENITLFNDFFSKWPFIRTFGEQKAKLITAIAMFYDLENPNKFLSEVKSVLAPNGVFVIQQNYLVGMLEQNAFDNIVHEHLEYYCLTSLEKLLERHGLEVFDVTQNDINGGSFRTYIRYRGEGANQIVTDRVGQMRRKETQLGLESPNTYDQFAKRVEAITKQVGGFIRSESAQGRRIFVYGASTRGNTLLQACGLNGEHLKYAAERNPFKWGKKTVGTNIPIISEEEARSMCPDYFLVLPWFFRDEFVQREQAYLAAGGKLIFPLPHMEVVSK